LAKFPISKRNAAEVSKNAFFNAKERIAAWLLGFAQPEILDGPYIKQNRPVFGRLASVISHAF